MAIDKRVIKDIRFRKTIQEVETTLKVSQAVSDQLLAVSGVLERATPPAVLQQTAVDVQALLKLAQTIEAEEAMLDTPIARQPDGRQQV
jgi:hypothetical protein